MEYGKIILVSLLLPVNTASFCQQNDFRLDSLEGNDHFISSIELSPDGKTLAISTGGGPLFFWDVTSQKIIRKLDVTGYTWGSYLNYSADGKYLLLQQQYFTDWRINKDRQSRAEVLDVVSGKILLTVDNAHWAVFTPDGQSLATLQDEEIIFRNIISGTEEKKFKPGNITNAFAVSPDGNIIAVSQHATGEELKNISTVRNDKKAIKEAEKFREVVVFYDAKTFTGKFVADDIFDIVFSMKFSQDGTSLYLFNAPDRRLRTTPGAATRNGYIQAVNASDGKVSRVIYSTNASEPIYKESADKKYFAETSIEQKFRVLNSVLVFDRESGETVNNFVNDFRLTENTHIGRASFEFLPDNKTMVLGYGYYIATWNFKK